MQWQRKGDMGMISPPYSVGKFFTEGCTLYGLCFHDERIGYFECFDDAQAAADAHAKAQQGAGT